MHPAQVGRHNEYAISGSEFRETLGQQLLQLHGQIAVDISDGTIETHGTMAN